MPIPISRKSATSTISKNDHSVGGVLHFPDALKQYPGALVVLYSRMSSYGQAGPDRTKLKDAVGVVLEELDKLVPPEKVKDTVYGVESGKLAATRKHLLRACAFARYGVSRPCDLIVVAPDLSRFLRAATYDRRRNRLAQPTENEFAELHRRTGHVILATLLPPTLSEDERHSVATRRTRKAGRPKSIDDELAAQIFEALGPLYLDDLMGWRWGNMTLAEAAEIFSKLGHKVSAATIHRASLRPSPNGKTWRELAIEKAAAMGLLEIRDNGDIICKVDRPGTPRGWYGKVGRPPKWRVHDCN